MMMNRSRGMSADGDTDWPIDQTVKEALAELAGERTLTVEIGALRLMLLRLLAEDGDVGRLAGYVARVAGVAVQAAKAQGEIAGEDDDPLLAQFLEYAADYPTSPSRKDV
jgi:hypothetical protein